MFGKEITPIMLEKHLVSWEDRQADIYYPARGGSRNRYVFRTLDGKTPSTEGQYRLYKRTDQKFDGQDKTGKLCPLEGEIDSKYHYLLEWYKSQYSNSR